MNALSVTLVHACLRDGTGGSPTAVVLDEPALSDEERRRVPLEWGTSHAVYVDRRAPTVSLRFFTAEGELPACGHGTVAALALLASRSEGTSEPGPGAGPGYRATLRAAGRVFDGWAERDGDHLTAAFDPGPVDLRAPTEAERTLVLPALGLTPEETGPSQTQVAGVGRERLLVSVPTREHLAALTPDLDRLRAACDRFGLLGAYVYCEPSPEARLAARMFAPSIGVPEDIANANSTACLAAHLALRGFTGITVDMGDTLGSPATITATAHPGPTGLRVHVGGSADVTAARRLP
ncbi:PhzF family phenazine biosynthesis protein [Streptomyces sp. NPDC047081]|uniref:PhzF family phenazine biosynthesis protein n=1 Tax=Streptomyces sp. NPDC047081 TaxID=3154706 RepID=UPI0034085D29